MTPLPYNMSAVRACKDFAVGRDYLVALVGPSGWGKSLLLQSVADWMSHEYHQEINVHNALDWLKNPPRAETLVPVILDDIQEAVRRPRSRHQLRAILERRIKLRRPTLISMTAWNGPSGLSTLVPYDRDWTLGIVEEPSINEKKVIIAEMAHLAGIKLSPALTGLMAHYVNGNGCSINGALHCLSLMKTDWSGREDVCRACGILMPFFILHENWDPRDEIYETVQRVKNTVPACQGKVRAISCYLMISLANLGEDVVARYLRLTPAKVYSHNGDVMAEMKDPEFFAGVEECRNAVISAFSRF